MFDGLLVLLGTAVGCAGRRPPRFTYTGVIFRHLPLAIFLFKRHAQRARGGVGGEPSSASESTSTYISSTASLRLLETTALRSTEVGRLTCWPSRPARPWR